MGHNKWMVACLGCLAISAIPGGLSMMLGVLACVACAGGCFAKWLVEEVKLNDKYAIFFDKPIDK